MGEDSVELACVYTEREREQAAQSVVLVTSRNPNDSLYAELEEKYSIERIGDCNAPGTIAHAVYAGHRYAREMDASPDADIPFRREHALAPPKD